MKGHFSLRWRMVLSLLGVFGLGIAATALFYRWELRDIEGRLRHAPATSSAAAIQLEQMVEEDVEFLGFILVPFSFAAMGVLLFITHWSLRGLQQASRRAEEIDTGRLDARLETIGLPNEIVPLVRAVNGSLGRLSEALQAEQRLTANAAHELRTPLAVLQMRLQSARLSGALDWSLVEQDLGRMRRVIDQLLDLARRDSAQHTGGPGDHDSINLARVLREATAEALPLAEAAGRIIDIDAPDQVLVAGSAGDLRDMLRNLLDNALQHGRGHVQVLLQLKPRSGVECAVVRIEDEGDGVPEALHDAAFERFRMLTSHSQGAGLGLAIVRQIVRRHGGEARFVSHTGGAVEVVLPLLGNHQARSDS